MTKWLNDTIPSRKEKPAPTVRGGFVILRRHASKSTLRASPHPYEHATLRDARKQAEILCRERGAEFAIFREVASYTPAGDDQTAPAIQKKGV